MIKTLYAIEYDNQVVWDWEDKRDAVYLSLYEIKQNKHRIWKFYKENVKGFQNTKFKDFKIVEYVAKESSNNVKNKR